MLSGLILAFGHRFGRSWHEGRWQWWHKRKQSKTALADRSYYHAMQLPSKVVFFNATSTMTWLTALTLLSSSAEIQRVLAAPDYAALWRHNMNCARFRLYG